MKQQSKGNKKRGRAGRVTTLLILIFFILALFQALRSCMERARVQPPELKPAVEKTADDSVIIGEPEQKGLFLTETLSIYLEDTPQEAETEKYDVILIDSALPEAAFNDSLYVYADPWGGRHFDSVTVSLFCRESCLVLYSFEDSIHLKSYDHPLKIRRNAKLWIAGVNDSGSQSEPVEIVYTIEKRKGDCPSGMMPFRLDGGLKCMDIYEWPNTEGEEPTAFVNQGEAADSCRSAGKRLCSYKEWNTVCRGPEGYRYPYGSRYNENHCPAKEASAVRSGRFPACRSYYGVYDLVGNLWEWTATPSSRKEGFFLVAGGNWDTGGQAACDLQKFSFYPQNRYLFVGFRCCVDK
jgi:hypothetical protein